MSPVSKGEGENPRKMGQLVCGTPGTSHVTPSSGKHPVLLHGVASILHQPAHSPLCPMPGAPQCPELTRPRAHLYHRSREWAMELLSPLPTSTRVQHNTGLPMLWVPLMLFLFLLVEGDDPTHPRRCSPLWGQLHDQLFPAAQKPITVLLLLWGDMSGVSGYVPQGSGLAG